MIKPVKYLFSETLFHPVAHCCIGS